MLSLSIVALSNTMSYILSGSNEFSINSLSCISTPTFVFAATSFLVEEKDAEKSATLAMSIDSSLSFELIGVTATVILPLATLLSTSIIGSI